MHTIDISNQKNNTNLNSAKRSRPIGLSLKKTTLTGLKKKVPLVNLDQINIKTVNHGDAIADYVVNELVTPKGSVANTGTLEPYISADENYKRDHIGRTNPLNTLDSSFISKEDAGVEKLKNKLLNMAIETISA